MLKFDEKDFVAYMTYKGLAPQSIRHYKLNIRVVNNWFNGKEFSKELIEQFFLERINTGIKQNTLKGYVGALRKLKEYLDDRGFDSKFLNYLPNYEKEKPQIIIFTEEEIKAIIAAQLEYGIYRGKDCSFLDYRYSTLTMMLAYTGCRFGEASKLKIQDVEIGDSNVGRLQLIHTKNKDNRTLYIAEPLISRLKNLIKDRGADEYVFLNAAGSQVKAPDFSEDLKKRAIKAGVLKRTFPHNFRHSYITHMLEAGTDALFLAKLTGHRDVQVIYDTYMHLADKTLEKASMRNPLLRASVDPKYIVEQIKETIENFHLEEDKERFIYVIQDTDKGFSFSVEMK